jgi:uncharacterized protein GlcG (DUF336 family)
MTSHYAHQILDEAGVDAVLGAAEQHALQNGHRVVIAVVERSGELVGLRRTPGAQVASSRVAVDKARTAAIFIRPSRELERSRSTEPARSPAAFRSRSATRSSARSAPAARRPTKTRRCRSPAPRLSSPP